MKRDHFIPVYKLLMYVHFEMSMSCGIESLIIPDDEHRGKYVFNCGLYPGVVDVIAYIAHTHRRTSWSDSVAELHRWWGTSKNWHRVAFVFVESYFPVERLTAPSRTTTNRDATLFSLVHSHCVHHINHRFRSMTFPSSPLDVFLSEVLSSSRSSPSQWSTLSRVFRNVGIHSWRHFLPLCTPRNLARFIGVAELSTMNGLYLEACVDYVHRWMMIATGDEKLTTLSRSPCGLLLLSQRFT